MKGVLWGRSASLEARSLLSTVLQICMISVVKCGFFPDPFPAHVHLGVGKVPENSTEFGGNLSIICFKEMGTDELVIFRGNE